MTFWPKFKNCQFQFYLISKVLLEVLVITVVLKLLYIMLLLDLVASSAGSRVVLKKGMKDTKKYRNGKTDRQKGPHSKSQTLPLVYELRLPPIPISTSKLESKAKNGCPPSSTLFPSNRPGLQAAASNSPCRHDSPCHLYLSAHNRIRITVAFVKKKIVFQEALYGPESQRTSYAEYHAETNALLHPHPHEKSQTGDDSEDSKDEDEMEEEEGPRGMKKVSHSLDRYFQFHLIYWGPLSK